MKQTKRSVGITLFGIFGIIWGVLMLLSLVTLLAKYPSIVSKFPEFPEFTFLKMLMIFPPSLLLLFGILFVAAGIGVLKLRPWGHGLFIIIGGLLLFLTTLNFLIFGSFSRISGILISIFLACLILWFFNRDNIKVDFALSKNYLKKEKKTYFAFIVSVILVGLVYFCIIFNLKSKQPLLFYTPQKIDYEVKGEENFLHGYTKRRLLDYNIYLPSDFYLISLFSEIDIGISNPDKTNFLLFTNKPLFELMLPIGRIFGVDSSYEFGKRFIHEKVSVVFLILRNVSTASLGKFDEVYFGDWKGFLQRGIRKKGDIYDYALWHEQTKNLIGLTFIVKEKTLTQDKIKDIVSSLNLDFPQKTAKEHFQEGLGLFKQAKYEEAKFSFANALYQNWINPQYHYYLGCAFFETENWNSARYHLVKAVSLQPDYLEAQKLLDRVKAEGKK